MEENKEGLELSEEAVAEKPKTRQDNSLSFMELYRVVDRDLSILLPFCKIGMEDPADRESLRKLCDIVNNADMAEERNTRICSEYEYKKWMGYNEEDRYLAIYAKKRAGREANPKVFDPVREKDLKTFVDNCNFLRTHLDDSAGASQYTRAVYNLLWGRLSENNRIEPNIAWSFKPLRAFTPFNILFGGDTMNKPKEIHGNIPSEEMRRHGTKDLYCNYNRLGNFTMVPAYFSRKRRFLKVGGSKLSDYFDLALMYLKQEEFDIKKELILHISPRYSEARKKDVGNRLEAYYDTIYRNFPTSLFNRYINTMFLWDYVKGEEDEYRIKSLISEGHASLLDPEQVYDYTKLEDEEVENFVKNSTRAIDRRSKFMALLLKIAVDFREIDLPKERVPVYVNDYWKDWDVSDLYKQIVKRVFTTERIFSGYAEVLDALDDAVDAYLLEVKDYVGWIAEAKEDEDNYLKRERKEFEEFEEVYLNFLNSGLLLNKLEEVKTYIDYVRQDSLFSEKKGE